MARRIESHRIPGPAGKLEALLEEPEDGDPCKRRPGLPSASALRRHHAQQGGLPAGARAAAAGAVVLRFNFRGVGRSQGKHAHGAGEVEDARAALAWLRARYPELPFTLAGFSFGSRVVLQLGCIGEPKPRRVIAAGFPTRFGRGCLSGDVLRAQSLHPEHRTTSTGPARELEPLFAALPNPSG